MSESRQVSISRDGVSKMAIIALGVIFATGLFVVGFENGQIINMVFAQGGAESPIDPLIIHEFSHDLRHAMGFPCH